MTSRFPPLQTKARVLAVVALLSGAAVGCGATPSRTTTASSDPCPATSFFSGFITTPGARPDPVANPCSAR